jgi:hypothetical protein
MFNHRALRQAAEPIGLIAEGARSIACAVKRFVSAAE